MSLSMRIPIEVLMTLVNSLQFQISIRLKTLLSH